MASWYTLKEVAAIANVSDRTVRRWIYGGHLRAHRLGQRNLRISQEDWDEFVTDSEVHVSTRVQKLNK